MSTRDHRVLDAYSKQAAEFAQFEKLSRMWRYFESGWWRLQIELAFAQSLSAPVLDLGCGSGRVVRLLASEGIPSNRIVGVDGCEELVAIARTECPGTTFWHEDIRALDLPTRDFAFVTSHMVLQGLSDEDFSIALVRTGEHMREGGILSYMVTHPLREREFTSLPYTAREQIDVESPWGQPIPNFLRPVGVWVNLTIDAGFAIERVWELPIPDEMLLLNPPEYHKYAQFGAVRLAIRARKLR